jgi:uncharacterized membrane protein SpoIIM required for sporulation
LVIPHQPEQSQRTNWFDMKKRGVWVIVFFVVAVTIMAVGAKLPVNPTDAQTSYNELQTEFKYVATVPGIFGNNFFQSLILFTPFVGPLYGALVFFNTGTVIAIIASATNSDAGVQFAELFIYPHTWLEFIAYSLAMSQSVFLSTAVVRERVRQELVRTCIIITVCALILLIAAIFEVTLIALRG